MDRAFKSIQHIFMMRQKNGQIAHCELSPEEGVASEAEGSTPGTPLRTWSAAAFNIEDGGWSWVGFRLCIIGLLDFEYLVSFLLLLWSDFSIKLTESLESWIRLRQSFLCDLLTNSQNDLFLLKTTRTILSGNSCHFVNLLIFANTFSFLF